MFFTHVMEHLQALEKAVADVFPNASKKIESSIKNIANYQAPRSYVLKQGLEVETSRRHASEEGRYNLSHNTIKFLVFFFLFLFILLLPKALYDLSRCQHLYHNTLTEIYCHV
ncbi:hypothetical protein PVAP13_9NG277814 [Panicum virgatum]|uniref:Uncharacterized protein n=1 Tax=Panicum virgatum TaxID=38727 RepID=A0A8T0MQ94_PANVG|nr:hypothetical protein PVAP13_9NG277814 [Panicum virgatum]